MAVSSRGVYKAEIKRKIGVLNMKTLLTILLNYLLFMISFK